MTLDELLDCNADQLAALTNAQLEEYFRPFFDVTRPERQVARPSSKPMTIEDRQKAANIEKLKSMGIDVSGALQKFKKKR